MKKLILIAALVAAPLIAAKVNPADWVAIPDRDPAFAKLDTDRRPTEVLSFLGIKKGDKVLDYNAGAGYYTQIMARAVGPKGVVTAWNATQFVSNEKAKAKWAVMTQQNPNIRHLMQPFDGYSSAPKSYTFALFHLVYHDLYWQSAQFGVPKTNPDLVLKNLHASMKSGGIVGVIDHVGLAGDTRAIVDKTHRIDPETVKADFARAGFKFIGSSDVLKMRGDDHTRNVFEPGLRGKTDRFVLKFKK